MKNLLLLALCAVVMSALPVAACAQAPIYQKHLTLKDIIAFNDSPVGRKPATATPLITKESMQAEQQLGMEIVADIQKALKEYNN